MNPRPPVIGLVGGIGAGKSTVARALADLGCVVCDSDALARASLADQEIRQRLRARWGERVLAADGSIDRRAVAAIVFSDPAERAFLEGLTHPWIEAQRSALFAHAPPSAKALVIDAPLLLEAGLARQCDAILFVEAPRSERLERVTTDRAWSVEELDRREAAQWPEERKRASSTHVIVNGGDLSQLRLKVERFLESLLRDRSTSGPPVCPAT